MTETEKEIVRNRYEEIFESNNFEAEAEKFCDNIKRLAEVPDALEALKSYLSYHFQSWLQEWMATPSDAAEELGIWLNASK